MSIRENEIQRTNIVNGGETDLTPIEVMLDIQDDGTTTARKLYDYLQLDKGHFSRWIKKNITENDFAVENNDFVRLALNGETPTGGKVTKDDYKITASFAKKLCMTSHSERGEQARNYFIKVEDKLKERSQQSTMATIKQTENLQKDMIFITGVVNQMATATSQYMSLMSKHEEIFKKEIVEIARDSINAKDLQIEKTEELIGIRDRNTKYLTMELKEKLSNLTGQKINARNQLYIKIKNKIFRKYKVFTWEQIPIKLYNNVYADIDSLEKDDIAS